MRLLLLSLFVFHIALADEPLNKDGVNALTVAVRKCDPNTVSTVLKSGAKPNSRNRDGTTALMWVGFFQNPTESTKLEVAKMLVEHGADVNAKDNYGKSVLAYQATYKLGQVISYLMKKGAKDTIDAKGAGPRSALLEAIESRNPVIVTKLIEGGVNPNNDRIAWAAMHYDSPDVRAALIKSPKFDKKFPGWAQMAAAEGRSDILSQLIAMGGDINTPGEGNRTALLTAIEKDKVDAAKILIEAGAKTDTLSKSGYGSLNGETALCLASRKGQLETVNALIAKKADVNATCGALDTAVKGGYTAIVNALIAAGADLKDRYVGNWKALFSAVDADRKDIGESLIKGGVRVDVRDNMDSTPLMIAAEKGSLNMIRLLVSKGADLQAKNERRPMNDVGSNYIGTPLGWAVEYKQTAAAALLRELGAKN